MATSFTHSPSKSDSFPQGNPNSASLQPQPRRKSSTSFFQQFVELTERLYRVPGFDQFLDYSNSSSNDPVATLWNVFRNGQSLAHLYNIMFPDERLPEKVNAKSSTNAAKATVYHFLLGLKTKLYFTEDETFTISELYQDDTNGFVKVMNTINLLLDKLEAVDLLSPRPLHHSRRPSVLRSFSSKGKVETTSHLGNDHRSKVVMELLETERIYMTQLEKLQEYMREVQQQALLSNTTLQLLFVNLNAVVDFQRRFLFRLETEIQHPINSQHIGKVFLDMEEGFSVYEPFCANYGNATELVQLEAEKLLRVAHIIEPTRELASYLIKPVQRICKYPLLLREYMKSPDIRDYPYIKEMEAGINAVKRVTDRVNETQRMKENRQLSLELEKKVDDWKGLNIKDFGELFLNDTFTVSANDIERELSIFLFKKILLCCKEKEKNTNLLGTKRKSFYNIKGTIYVYSLTHVVDHTHNGDFSLKVYWKDLEMESLVLKCRNEEQMTLWHSTLSSLIAESMKRNSPLPGANVGDLTYTLNSNLKFLDNDEEDDERISGSSHSHHSFPLSNSQSIPVSRKPAPISISTRMDVRDGPSSPTAVTKRQLRSATPIEGSRQHIDRFPPRRRTQGNVPMPITHDGHLIGGSRKSTPITPRQRGQEKYHELGLQESGDEISGYSQEIRRGTVKARMAGELPPGRRMEERAPSREQENVPPGLSRRSLPKFSPPNPPNTPQNPSFPASHRPQKKNIKVKAHYMDEIYVMVVSPEISFSELSQRILQKVRMSKGDDTNGLRIRYRDEDGDFITINSDEDIQMAFELSWSTTREAAGYNIVNLHII